MKEKTEIEEIINKAVKTAIEEYQKAEKKKSKSEFYNRTFELMKRYKDACFIEKYAGSIKQNEIAAADNNGINDSICKTIIIKDYIDKALAEIEKKRAITKRSVEYEAFCLYFMHGLNYEDIAEILNTGKNTPRRWISGIINELSGMIWGFNEKIKK